MFDLRNLSFGTPAALVTSMGLIVGLEATASPKSALLGGLLIVGLADNLTDALSVHIYQEAERLPGKEAFRTTVANFAARLCTALSFVAIVALLPIFVAIPVSLVWGFLLLCALSYLLAKARSVSVFPEILKHCAVATVVIVASEVIGTWVLAIRWPA